MFLFYGTSYFYSMSYRIEFNREAGSGQEIMGTAGEDLGNRKVVYINSDGTWKLADADAATTMPVIGLTMGAIASGKKGLILINGFIGLGSWSWNIGERLYASENIAGELTQTAPQNPDHLTQEIGIPITTKQIFFSPRQTIGSAGATYTKTISLPADELGKPVANNPVVVDHDNVTLYSFTVNTDILTYKLPIPSDYASGGLKLNVVWTNDGGSDDNDKNVKAQFDYQTATEGDAISGSHANSPKTVEDTYESASGWIEFHSDYVTIAEADFTDKFCIYVKISFVTPTPTALSCKPHLMGLCLQYMAYTFAQ